MEMNENIHILLYYKYVPIENPEELKVKHLEECNKIGLRGRILLSKEGINGSVSGSKEQVEEYKRILTTDKRFKGIQFKEDIGISHPFRRMIIKIKKEIVRLERDVDLKNTGKHITPREFLKIYDMEEKPIIIDARNEYEARVGKFKDAITLPIKKFSEFPSAIKKLNIPKDKKVVMYCTGGVRCEKASAFMKEEGFNDVSQLSGGILTFGKEFPDTVWEGMCFVFDKRLLSKINSRDNDSPISECESCGVKCNLYKNCRNVRCDEYTILCIPCDDKLAGCCSEECFEEWREKGNSKILVKNFN